MGTPFPQKHLVPSEDLVNLIRDMADIKSRLNFKALGMPDYTNAIKFFATNDNTIDLTAPAVAAVVTYDEDTDSFTVVQDGWIYARGASSGGTVSVNDLPLIINDNIVLRTYSFHNLIGIVPVKAGDVITYTVPSENDVNSFLTIHFIPFAALS